MFYHSYAEAHILFDIQTAIYEILNPTLEPDANRVILRLYEGPFQNLRMADIKQELNTRVSNRNIRIRELLISAACSLFPNNDLDEIRLFPTGYVCGDLDFYRILKQLFVKYKSRINKEENEKEIDELITKILKSKYINPSIKPSYLKSKPFLHSFHCTEFGDGQMLQIFIKKSILDEITYISQPLGSPYSGDETDCAASTNQVRILAHPQYFMNPDLVRVYRYAANENIYKNRLEFITFLKELLNRYLFMSIQ